MRPSPAWTAPRAVEERLAEDLKARADREDRLACASTARPGCRRRSRLDGQGLGAVLAAAEDVEVGLCGHSARRSRPRRPPRRSRASAAAGRARPRCRRRRTCRAPAGRQQRDPAPGRAGAAQPSPDHPAVGLERGVVGQHLDRAASGRRVQRGRRVVDRERARRRRSAAGRRRRATARRSPPRTRPRKHLERHVPQPRRVAAVGRPGVDRDDDADVGSSGSIDSASTQPAGFLASSSRARRSGVRRRRGSGPRPRRSGPSRRRRRPARRSHRGRRGGSERGVADVDVARDRQARRRAGRRSGRSPSCRRRAQSGCGPAQAAVAAPVAARRGRSRRRTPGRPPCRCAIAARPPPRSTRGAAERGPGHQRVVAVGDRDRGVRPAPAPPARSRPAVVPRRSGRAGRG